MHVFMPDRWHFHRRNFASLFDDLKAHGIAFTIGRARGDWWKRHGDYEGLADRLTVDFDRLAAMDVDGLLAAEVAGVPLLAVSRDEFLCRALPRPRWRDGFGANDVAAVARHACADTEDRRLLLLNAAAAANWVRHWRRHFIAHPEITHVLAFSGAYIYTRTLLMVAKALGRRCFVLETFFTGNEFYLEERTDPLPNASGMAAAPWPWPGDAAGADRLRAAGHARLAGMRNKNVRAVDGDLVRHFPVQGNGPRVLVVGQVLNDFSLTNTALAEGSALAFYRRLIASLLDAGCRVVFKAHPWEHKRPNLRRAFTLNGLLQTFGADHPRLRLVERDPIGDLFAQVDHVVGLCSQGLLEACQAGFKPVQFGNAFYGGQGFTHDRAQEQADEAAAAIAAGTLAGRLSLDEYRRFEDFLAKALEMHLLPSRNAPRGSVVGRLGLVPLAGDAVPMGPPAAARAGWRQFAREIASSPRPWLGDAAYLLRRALFQRGR